VEPYGSISLLVTFGEVDLLPLEHIVFYINDFAPTYDAIISMSALHRHCCHQPITMALGELDVPWVNGEKGKEVCWDSPKRQRLEGSEPHRKKPR
jgi:hypothetical protein